MRMEVSHRLGCSYYQRSVKRRGYRNGSYARDLLTSYGWIKGLVVPRVRQGGFQPLCLERYRRRQRAVDRVLLEAFFHVACLLITLKRL
jgi:putative transposase